MAAAAAAGRLSKNNGSPPLHSGWRLSKQYNYGYSANICHLILSKLLTVDFWFELNIMVTHQMAL